MEGHLIWGLFVSDLLLKYVHHHLLNFRYQYAVLQVFD